MITRFQIHVQNKNLIQKISERNLRLSHLKLGLTNFTCVSSKTNCNFLPVATGKGLTQCGGDDTPDMHPSCKSFILLLTRRRLNPIQAGGEGECAPPY